MDQYDSADPHQPLPITNPIELYRAANPGIKIESWSCEDWRALPLIILNFEVIDPIKQSNLFSVWSIKFDTAVERLIRFD